MEVKITIQKTVFPPGTIAKPSQFVIFYTMYVRTWKGNEKWNFQGCKNFSALGTHVRGKGN